MKIKKELPKFFKSGYFFGAIILAILIFSAGLTLISLKPGIIKTAASLDQLTKEVIEKCQNSKYQPDCYDKQIPLLMAAPNSLSMEEAFKVSKILQSKVTNYNFCHVLGHKIASFETQKDPSKWKEVISRCPSGTCSNGCIHGAFQEKFRAESLPPGQLDSIKGELKIVCRKRSEWNPTGIEQGSCYHALGHLAMYLTNADIQKSLSLCTELAFNETGQDFTRVCFDGVFMQIFQPLEPEDFALVRGKVPTKENLKTFCASFGQDSFGSCWGESWPLFKDLQTVEGAIKYCQEPSLSNSDQNRCFTNLFYRAPIQLNFDSDKSLNYCKNFPENIRGLCFAQVALRFVQSEFDFIDKAVDFCQKSIQFDPKEKCFEELASRASYNFQKNSRELETMCSKLPEGWKNRCQRN